MKDGKFTRETRDLLAAQAGYRCSAPWCNRATIAASDSTASGKADIGEAAHIRGRAKTSARYDPDQTNAQRASSDNGLWLCRSDAALIDRDERLYSTELLHEWKQARIEGTRREQKGELVRLNGPFPTCLSVSGELLGELSVSDIRSWLRAAGVGEAWGSDVMDGASNLTFELVDNARRHSRAGAVTLSSSLHIVEIEYVESDASFGMKELSELSRSGTPSGGAAALAYWEDKFADRFPISSVTSGEPRTRRWTITNLHRDATDPCAIRIVDDAMIDADGYIQTVAGNFPAGCIESRIHIEHFVSTSAMRGFPALVDVLLKRGPVTVISDEPFVLDNVEFLARYLELAWGVERSEGRVRIIPVAGLGETTAGRNKADF